jgi:cytoskeletal protein RodZ
MTEFGSTLRQARERRGISLRQIATSTKISMVVLEALERDDFSHLPGGIFSRAFVRAYAIEVGIDPEETVQHFLTRFGEAEAAHRDTETPVEVSADDRAFLERQRQASRILRIAAIVLVVVVVAALSIWRITARQKATSRVEPAAVTEPTGDGPPAERPATAVASAPGAAVPTAQPTAAAPAGDTARTAAIAVQLEASDICWTEVSVDGKVAMKDTLVAGQRLTFSADREVIVTAGNAGALSWTLNGKPAKPIGKAGEVQTVRVTLDNLSTLLR